MTGEKSQSQKRTATTTREKPEPVSDDRKRKVQPKRQTNTTGVVTQTAKRGSRPLRKTTKVDGARVRKTPTTKPTLKSTPTNEVRLQKLIASAGITSRRKAEELITDGFVKVNGRTVVKLGTKVVVGRDMVTVRGKNITHHATKERVYLVLNKPRGYISAVESDKNKKDSRPVVTDLVKKIKTRVFPVGRLDYDAEGVLLLTNDGELTNKLIHPSNHVEKTYMVKVRNVPKERTLKKMEGGIHLDDGKTLPAKVRFVKSTKENSWIEITVTEGRNHLIKRMCMAVGHPVQKIKRINFAGIRLKTLKLGEYRMLTQKEFETLMESVGG